MKSNLVAFVALVLGACTDSGTGPPASECDSNLACEELCENRKRDEASTMSAYQCLGGFCACGFREADADCYMYVKPEGYSDASCPVDDEALAQRAEELRTQPEENPPATEG
jgi:hypothetical protein